MKTVLIPNDYNPYIVEVNGKTYRLPAGAEMEVPDDVADVINNYWALYPREGNPDGGVLPYIDKSDNGKVLKADDGNWHKGDDDKGTEVIANPTLAGTEAALTGLQVGNTKYKVPGFVNPMTAAGDLIVGGEDGAAGKLVKGADGKVLKMVSGAPAWADDSAGMVNPMTTAGDLIVGGTDGAAGRLAKGTDGQVLSMVSGAPAWAAASGGKIYLHAIDLKVNSLVTACYCEVYSTSSTPFTETTFATWLYNNGFIHGSDKSIVASGKLASNKILIGLTANSDPAIRAVVETYLISNNQVSIGEEGQPFTTIDEFNDVVIEV